MTGMSGLDTESMVRQIMQAESTRLHRVQRNRTKLEWRQEAYQGVTTRLNAFHNRFLSLTSPTSLIRQNTWANFNSSITAGGNNSNAVSVVAGANANVGNHTLQVTQRASVASISGTSTNTTISGGTIDMAAINGLASSAANGTDTILSFNLNLNGSLRTVSITADDINNLSTSHPVASQEASLAALIQDKANASGTGFGANRIQVNAVSDGGGGFSLNIRPQGNGHTLAITDTNLTIPQSKTVGTTPGGGPSLLSNVNDFVDGLSANAHGLYMHTINVNGRDVNIDFTSFKNATDPWTEVEFVTRINSALSLNGIHARFQFDAATQDITLESTGIYRETLTFTDSSGSGNELFGALGIPSATPVTLGPTNSLSFLGGIKHGDTNHFGANDTLGGLMFTTPPVDASAVTAADIFSFNINGSNSRDFVIINTKRPATEDMAAFRASLAGLGITEGTTLLFADENVTTLTTAINNSNAGVNFSYNSLNQTFTLQSTREGLDNGFTLDTNAAALFNALGIGASAAAITGTHNGQDAIFELDGVLTSRESNTFIHNGVTFTLNQGAETAGLINIGLTRDTSATLNFIRDFVEAYNELRTSITDMTHERRARSMGTFFEPLTDEERRGMSESEIARWEEQARTGLMRRNDSLTHIVNQMRSELFNGVVLADGTTMSLDRIGITPSNRPEDRGILVIDEARLAAALEEHGDRIGEMFYTQERKDASGNAIRGSIGLGDRLVRIINDATGVMRGGARGTLIERAGGTSATDANNDLARMIRREDERIANITRLLQRREESLYRMFGRLEVALTQSDSQMNFMMQMFWQG